jgi:acetolactate synthase-1/2/3 large subunit
MYTVQALWTMAREHLNVTSIIFNNRSYGILNLELERVGATGAGPRAKAQLDLGDVPLDFVSIGNGLGVSSCRVDTADGLVAALQRALAEPGPHLIEAVVPPVYSDWKLKAIPKALGALAHLPAPIATAVKRRVYP